MKTKYSIEVGNKVLLLRQNGNIVLFDKDHGSFQTPQILATSSAGAVGLGSALLAMAKWIRENK